MTVCSARRAGIDRARLCQVDLQPPVRVTLSGAKSGEYLVVEERSDGSLVLAPSRSSRPARASRTPASPIGTLFSGLRRPVDTLPTSDAEVLEGWGLQVREDERIRDVFLADLDQTKGFLAITSERFVFAADASRGRTVVEEHPLSTVRGVEMVRRGIRHKLRVSWEGAECVIGVLDRTALSRLQGCLEEAQRSRLSD